MPRYAALTGLLLCAAAVHAPARGQIFQDDEIFSRGMVGGWTMEAATIQDPLIDPPPQIRSIECSAVNAGMAVVRRRDGSHTVHLRDREGERYSTLTIDRVRIGGATYNARSVSTRFSNRYSNVSYPPESDIVLTYFQGYLGIEARPGLWLPVDHLLRDFLSGAPVAVRHRRMSGQGLIWSPIDTAGLPAALAWCDRAIASDAARRFHGSDR
jgi:hypothetical protein